MQKTFEFSVKSKAFSIVDPPAKRRGASALSGGLGICRTEVSRPTHAALFEQFAQWLREGPRQARVTDVIVTKAEVDDLSDFRVR